MSKIVKIKRNVKVEKYKLYDSLKILRYFSTFIKPQNRILEPN